MKYPLNYVVDTNILIDVRNGRLVTEFFRLPFNMQAPDVIVSEMVDGDGAVFVAHGLEERQLSGKQVQEVSRLRLLQPNVSVPDMFAMVLARVSRATLLTGDKNLRRLAKQEKVNVHGMLWVLDELVRLDVISRFAAADALDRILAAGSRLPRVECDARLARWQAQASSGARL